MFNTPILFTIFNRPEGTRKVFDMIREQKPKRLFIAADGPRTGNTEDKLLCDDCRGIVALIDWQCDVKTLFQEKNLGCGKAMSSAITWFFEQVEEGIILEDDCLPNSSFFNFCEELLEKYRQTPQVMMICGTSYQTDNYTADSYYFSRYVHVWGWASWKRAWNAYSFSPDDPIITDKTLKKVFNRDRERSFWLNNMNLITQGLDTWDYQWMYSIWKRNGLSIIPWKNLISNIGFGLNATHTFDVASVQSSMQQHNLDQLTHPSRVAVDKKADQFERELLIGSSFHHNRKQLRSFIGRQLRKISNA